MNKDIVEKDDFQIGQIKMADDVVAIIAGLAAIEIPGVKAMSGGVVDGIAEVLRRKNLSKGVKVEVGEKEAAIELNIIIEYKAKIPEVTEKIQETVKKAVESMTGLKVIEININVQGVHIKEETTQEEIHRVK